MAKPHGMHEKVGVVVPVSLAAGGAFAQLYAAQFQGAATDLDDVDLAGATGPELARPVGR